jgi:ACS family tartrate transporter-like MFS transporter
MKTPDVATETLQKITLRLIPFLFILYIVAWLDRVNVGFAGLQMNADLGFSSAAFGFGSGVFFLGYCLFEVPSNLVLHRVGARRWISRIMISWGAISAAMMFVRTTPTFYVLRFLLGAAEAGFFPGVVYYLGHWYPEGQRARAIAAFMTAVPVSGVVGGPLSGALLTLNGLFGLAGWQWLFLMEGIPAILLGIIVLVYLTDRPETADWLSSAERDWLVNTLATERSSRRGSLSIGIFAALTNPTIWHLGIIFLFTAIGFYGYSFWAPLVVKSLMVGSDFGVGLILGAISALTIIAMMLNSAHSDQSDERPLHVAVPLLISGVGFFGCAVLREPILAVFSGAGSDRTLRRLRSILVDAVSVSHWSTCSRRDRLSGDYRKRGRLGWSYNHRRNERSLWNAWPRFYAAWWMRRRRSAARSGPWASRGPAKCPGQNLGLNS